MLQGELARARTGGVAADLEENSIGICAVAVALRLPNGDLAAVSIPVPTQRFAEHRARLEKLLLTRGGKLQQSLRTRTTFDSH